MPTLLQLEALYAAAGSIASRRDDTPTHAQKKRLAIALYNCNPSLNYTGYYTTPHERNWTAAIGAQKIVTFSYTKPGHHAEVRFVLPEGVKENGNLVGYDVRRKAHREFAPDRIGGQIRYA